MSRAAGVLPEQRGSVFWTRAARFSDLPRGARVHIAGVARELERPLTSPVMQQPCVAFRVVVEEPAWRPVLELTGCESFLVQDGEVAVRIDGPFRVLLQANFEIDFGDDVQRRIARLIKAEGGPRTRAPSRLEAWLARAQWDPDEVPPPRPSDPIASQNYRYFEARVQPGARVTVEGFASLTVDPRGDRSGLREPPLLYAVTGTQDRPVVIAFPEPGSVDR